MSEENFRFHLLYQKNVLKSAEIHSIFLSFKNCTFEQLILILINLNVLLLCSIFQHKMQKYTRTDGFLICPPTLMDFLKQDLHQYTTWVKTRVWTPEGKSKPKIMNLNLSKLPSSGLKITRNQRFSVRRASVFLNC